MSIHLANQECLHDILSRQGYVIWALDGLRPDVGHEVLWVLRDSVSGKILLARPLLSECEADLAKLITEVQATLPVPI